MDEEEKKLAEELLFSEKKNPSFAKQLFLGKFDRSLVFPYPYPEKSEEEETARFVGKVSEFASVHLNAAEIDRQAQIPDEVLKGLADMGVLGMTVPKEYAGLGMSQRAYCKVTDRIARQCGSTALFINVHQSIGLKALLLFGTEEQKEKWLPDLAKGKKYAAFSLTEPNAGSDANGVETKAVYDPEKKVYRINGLKQWTTNGSIADILTVMAKTEVETKEGVQERVTAFLVTPDMPGFIVRDKALDKLGTRGAWTANLAFNHLEVPEENILGPLGGGLKVCLTLLDYGRTTFGAMCTGAARELVQLGVKHARERYQFKRPLASFSLVKKKIAKICSLLYAMDASTYLTAGLIDNGVEDIMLESAILKVFTSDALWEIIYEVMQILGGRSFFTDQPYERMMRDARLNMIGEGSNEVLRAFIGAVGMRGLGVELQKGVFSNAGKLFSRLFLPAIPVRSQRLSKEAKELAAVLRKLHWYSAGLLAKHGEDIVECQLQLNRIASIAMSVYTMSAVLSKLDTDKPSGRDLSIGIYFIRSQLALCRRWFKGIGSNDDEASVKLADAITGI